MIQLPKDAEGREIPLDTEVLYDANGKKVHITSFTYKCDVHSLWSQWKVFSPDIKGEKEGMLPADSLYLTPSDSWEKLDEDLSEISKGTVCHYFHKGDSNACEGCPAAGTGSCWPTMARDLTSRIRKLRGEDDA